MTQKTKRLAGRPRYDRQQMVDMLNTYKDGPGTVHELTRLLGISTQTFYEFMKEDTGFSEAVMRVRDEADDRVEASLFDRAVGYSYTETSTKSGSGKDGQSVDETTIHEKELVPDVGAQMNWLKNRRPDKWRDKKEVEINSASYGAMLNAMREELSDDDA